MVSLDRLLQWFAQQGVVWDDMHLSITTSAGTTGPALGIYATADIAPGHRLCLIPKAAVLSRRNVAIADALEDAQIGGGLSLNIAVMHELAHGTNSPWYGYFQSLPHREHLPVFWTDEELNHLQGCSLQASVHTDRQHMREDYEELVLPFIQQHSQAFPDQSATTYDAFCRAASLVASRAFCVDHYHGDCLVPFADIFNHKSSMVVLGDQYKLDGVDDSSSEEEEEEEEEDQKVYNNNVQRSARQKKEQQVQKQKQKQQKHTPQQQKHTPQMHDAVLAMEAANSDIPPALRLEIAVCSVIEGGEEALEIVAAQSLTAGQEVHNTYGEHSNRQLLNKHGFTLRHNPFDVIELDKQVMARAAQEHLGTREWRRRAAYLEKHSALLDDDDEPLLLYAPHAVSLSLLVLLRAITMNDAEFSALESVEALVPDAELAQDDRWDADVDPQTCMTNDMRTLLHGLCTKQLEEYPASLQASLHRWTQLGGPMLPGHANVVGDAMSNTSVSSAQEIAVERAALGLRIGEQEVLHAVCTKLLEVPTPPPPKRARRAQ